MEGKDHTESKLKLKTFISHFCIKIANEVNFSEWFYLYSYSLTNKKILIKVLKFPYGKR